MKVNLSRTHRHNLRRRLIGIAGGTLLNALSILLLQILALVALAPSDFGRFSALYLLSALSTSVLLSVLCEAWQRQTPHAGWPEYGATLFWLSLASGALALILCQLIPGFRDISYLSAVAVGLSAYRTGARYYALQQRSLIGVLPGDLFSVLVLLGGWIVFIFVDSVTVSTVNIVFLWSFSAIVSALASKPLHSIRIRAVRWWMKRHRMEIRTLLADSIILDASAIGTPYVLLPILGVAGFGIYRGLSNIAGPVKLILFPLRPLFSAYSLARFTRARVLLALGAVSAILGGLAYTCLWLLSLWGVELGTLTALAAYAPLASIFVGATLLNGVFYLIGRTHFSRRRLLSGRVVTSLIGIVLPVTGALLGGTGGAMLGVTLGTSAGAFVWLALALMEAQVAANTATVRIGLPPETIPPSARPRFHGERGPSPTVPAEPRE
ncbi:hypothetical protein SAMN05216274_1202 [Cryobacterium levicorallinum]|uniref:Membrane protein involved in the export of O-antigen and teichoic acid n=1 Tax=Cryobacterium levicorallinum TaxID=995038 RepID=A0ABY1EHQ3_9MICO|nr:hypothetical protein SAMN05216274_1202 [Cryobacterium levicorallinum]